jgi:hypothetical protein
MYINASRNMFKTYSSRKISTIKTIRVLQLRLRSIENEMTHFWKKTSNCQPKIYPLETKGEPYTYEGQT